MQYCVPFTWHHLCNQWTPLTYLIGSLSDCLIASSDSRQRRALDLLQVGHCDLGHSTTNHTAHRAGLTASACLICTTVSVQCIHSHKDHATQSHHLGAIQCFQHFHGCTKRTTFPDTHIPSVSARLHPKVVHICILLQNTNARIWTFLISTFY